MKHTNKIKVFIMLLFIISLFHLVINGNVQAEEGDANLVNKLHIDYPRSNQVFQNGPIRVSGWALNTSGIEEIKILVDDEVLGNAKIGMIRADVNKVYPGYPDGEKSGYEYILDGNAVLSGNRNITVQAIGKDGSIKSSNISINIIKGEPKTFIDLPKNNQGVNNKQLKISGWALNPSGIDQVKILVDNDEVGNAKTGIVRADVNKAYPGYPGGYNSGYEYILDIDTIKSGNHNITVQGIGKDGSIKNSNVSINVTKAEPRIFIDNPKRNQNASKELVKINGWALNASGIKEIKILVDDQLVGNARTGIVRADVNKAYPGYPDGYNSGYEYLLDVSVFKEGIRNIEVQAIGKDGSVKSSTVPIEVTKAEPRIYIDFPKNNQGVNNELLKISGWALNASGIKDVKILVDDKEVGNAKIGMVRADVNQAYPGYLGGYNSGYEYILDINSVQPGIRNITVQAIGNDGSIKSRNVIVNIIKAIPRIHIDSPTNMKLLNDELAIIRGWALNASGIKEVKVWVDVTELGSAKLGIVRVDVDNAYPGYIGGANSGYEYTLDISEMKDGIHNITLQAIGNDGSSHSSSVNVNIVKAIRYKYTFYDYTINELINMQVAKNPQTDLYGGGWKTASWEDTAYYINTDNFLDSNVQNVDSDYTYNNVGKVTVDKLNVRSHASTNSTIITQVEYGNEYAILDHENGWYKITANGKTGWVAGGFMEVEYINISNYTYLKITTGTLNVRSEPTTDKDNVLTQVKYNEEYAVLGISNGWFRINANGKTGWVSGNLVSLKSTPQSSSTYSLSAPVNEIQREMYQFLIISGSSGITVSDLATELKGKGILEGKAQDFIDAGLLYNINEVYLLAHARLETGNGSSTLATGVLVTTVDGKAVPPKTVYNMFGIGAKDQDPLRLGAEYAYKAGWFTPRDAIIGGAAFIGEGYVDKGQDTIYSMRWNPYNPGTHQYASDIGWATKQTKSIEMVMEICERYKSAILKFDIPKYK